MALDEKHNTIKMGALAAAIGMASGTASAATFNVTTTASGGIGSLAFAMELARNNGEDDVININTTGTIDMSNAVLPPHSDPTGSLTIVGPGSGSLTIIGRKFPGFDAPEPEEEAPPAFPLFLSVVSTPMTISGLTISGSDYGAVAGSPKYGEVAIPNNLIPGPIPVMPGYAEGGVTLDDVRITGAGKYSEGQVFVDRQPLTITNSTINNNSGFGGLINVEDGRLLISDSSISNNDNLGPVVEAEYSEVAILDSVISGNTTEIDEDKYEMAPEAFARARFAPWGETTGVSAVSSNLYIEGSQFSNNTMNAKYGGSGALYVEASYGSDVSIVGSSFSNNSGGSTGAATITGGYSRYGRTTSEVFIERSSFVGNEATDGDGGALRVRGGFSDDIDLELEIRESVFSGNTSADDGGAISASEIADFRLADSLLSGNQSADDGGAIDLSMSGSTVYSEYGGGYLTDRNGSITGSTITGNTAGGRAGGLDVSGLEYGEFAIIGSTISGNTSTNSEGPTTALSFYGDSVGYSPYAYGGTYNSSLLISQSTISGNSGDGQAVNASFYNYGGSGYGTLEVLNSTFSGNASAVDRAPIEFRGFDAVSIQHSTFIDNAGAGTDTAQLHIAAGRSGATPEVSTELVRSVLSSSNTYEVVFNGEDLAPGGGYVGYYDDMDVTIDNTVITQGDLAYGSENTLITRNGTLDNDGIGLDPGLGALANNGGPTETHAPLDDMSVVVDASGGALRPDGVDQRGVVDDGNSDLGSVEYVDPSLNTAPQLVVNIGQQISGNVGFALPQPIPVAEAFEDAEGDEVIVVDVLGLPAGLDYTGGFITGELTTAGEYNVTVTVTDAFEGGPLNERGEPALSTTATFDVVVSEGGGGLSDAQIAALLDAADDDDDEFLGGTPLPFFGTLAALAWLRRRRR